MDKVLKIILALCFILGIYFLIKTRKQGKRVRFKKQATYFGVPGKKPPNLPVRWGYRD